MYLTRMFASFENLFVTSRLRGKDFVILGNSQQYKNPSIL
jgi:hypothetical protein